MAVGERVRELRQARGVGQAELARAIGRLPQDVYKWEHGRQVPSDAVPALAKALDVTICELYGVDEGHPRPDRGTIAGRFVLEFRDTLTPADETFISEMAASLGRYRERLRAQEGIG